MFLKIQWVEMACQCFIIPGVKTRVGSHRWVQTLVVGSGQHRAWTGKSGSKRGPSRCRRIWLSRASRTSRPASGLRRGTGIAQPPGWHVQFGHRSAVVLVMGNPWVTQAQPVPHTAKPIPTDVGCGIFWVWVGFLWVWRVRDLPSGFHHRQ